MLGDNRIGYVMSPETGEKVSRVFGADGGLGSRWIVEFNDSSVFVILAIILMKTLSGSVLLVFFIEKY